MLISINHSPRLRVLLLPCIGVLSLVLSACAPDISGAYVARGESSALMLQIVVAADNQLSGTLHEISLTENGRVETFAAAVTGAVSGSNIAMSVRPNGLLTTETSITATHAPGSISLTWMEANRVSTNVLRRQHVSSFTRHAAALQQRGQAIQAERASQQRQARERRAAQGRHAAMASLATDLEQAAGRHVESISRVAQRETGFRAATAQMRDWLAQWRSAEEQSSRRSALNYRIQSAHWDMNLAEGDMRSSRDEFEARRRRLLASAAEHLARCGQAPEPACARLTQAEQTYRRDSERLGSALRRADGTITAERTQREQIVAQLD